MLGRVLSAKEVLGGTPFSVNFWTHVGANLAPSCVLRGLVPKLVELRAQINKSTYGRHGNVVHRLQQNIET